MIRTFAALVGAALLLLPAIGQLGPSNARWGIDSLAFFPAGVRALFGVVGLLGVAVALWAGRGPRPDAERRTAPRTPGPGGEAAVGAEPSSGGRGGLPVLLGGALLLGLLFIVFRASTALLGRGYDLLVALGRGEPPSPVSPLYNLVAPAFVRLQRAAGLPTVDEVGRLSILTGLVVALLAALLLRRYWWRNGETGAGVALIGVLLATQGALVVFFGQVEASPLFLGAVLLFLLLAGSAAEGRGGLAGAALAAALAVAAHPFGWALAPALLVAAAGGSTAGRRRRVVTTALVLAAAAVAASLAGGAGGAFAGGLAPQRLGEVGRLVARALFDSGAALPLDGTPAARLLDAANLALFTALPALLLLVALAFDAAGRRELVRPSALVALAALLPFVALRLGGRTPLGPMRDWDQFAGVGLALTAWAAFAAAPLVASMGAARRTLLGLAVLSGVLTIGPAVAIESSADRAVRRHLARIDGRPALEAPVAAGFHLAMGQRFLALSRTDLAGNAFERAWTAWPTAATAWRAGLTFLAAGRVEKAAAALLEVTRVRPDDGRGWTELGNAYCGMAQFERADEALHRAIALNPEDTAPRIHLARSLAMQGRSEAARAQLEAARPRLDPLDPLRADFELLDAQLPPLFVPKPR